MEGWEKVTVIIVTALPTLYEAFTDRFGEAKKDKVTDGIILVVASVILTAVAYLVLDNWIVVPLFLLVWRFVAFDYTVNAFLKKYSTNHPRINIWKYSGGTADYDKLTAKVHPVIRLVIRAGIFLGSVVLFLGYQ